MYSQIKIVGQVLKVINKQFEGVESYQIQMMLNDPKKGFEVVGIKVEKDLFNPEIKENVVVDIPVRIVSVQNNLYFSCVDKIIIRK